MRTRAARSTDGGFPSPRIADFFAAYLSLDEPDALPELHEFPDFSVVDLAAAPRLDLWRPLLSPPGIPILGGHVTGHPLLRDTVITTSPLIALDADVGWARTFSRWYVLGTPAGRVEAALAARLGQPGDAGRMVLPGRVPLDGPGELAALLEARARALRSLGARIRRH